MKFGIIYGLYDASDPEATIRYIGKTLNIKQRLSRHRGDARNTDTHRARWIRKIGLENLAYKILKDNVPVLDLDEAERYHIVKYKLCGADLSNRTPGGTGGALNPEALERMASKLRGRPLSEETKRKMSAVRKGKTHTEDAKRRMSEYWKARALANGNPFEGVWNGRKHSEDSKRKQEYAKRSKKIMYTNEEVVLRYSAGEVARSIADSYSVNPSTILRIIKKCGVATRRKMVKKKRTEFDEVVLLLDCASSMPIRDICKKHDASRSVVFDRKKKVKDTKK